MGHHSPFAAPNFCNSNTLKTGYWPTCLGWRATNQAVRRGSAAGAVRGRLNCLSMIRWFIVISLVLVCISWASPLLQKLGFGKLPGDLRFRLFGREWFIPLATTLLLSLVASLISHLI